MIHCEFITVIETSLDGVLMPSSQRLMLDVNPTFIMRLSGGSSGPIPRAHKSKSVDAFSKKPEIVIRTNTETMEPEFEIHSPIEKPSLNLQIMRIKTENPIIGKSQELKGTAVRSPVHDSSPLSPADSSSPRSPKAPAQETLEINRLKLHVSLLQGDCSKMREELNKARAVIQRMTAGFSSPDDTGSERTAEMHNSLREATANLQSANTLLLKLKAKCARLEKGKKQAVLLQQQFFEQQTVIQGLSLKVNGVVAECQAESKAEMDEMVERFNKATSDLEKKHEDQLRELELHLAAEREAHQATRTQLEGAVEQTESSRAKMVLASAKRKDRVVMPKCKTGPGYGHESPLSPEQSPVANLQGHKFE
jgi:rubrerythrin